MEKNPNPRLNRSTLAAKMLIGGLIGLSLIGFFLFTAGNGDPQWPSYWRARPLIVVTLSGAAGGAVFYFLHHFLKPAGWKKVLVNMIGTLVFLIGLWLGSVLGLAGTYWH